MAALPQKAFAKDARIPEIYIPFIIVQNLVKEFFPYRGLALAARGLAPSPPGTYDADRVNSDMKNFGYVRLDALRDRPRGARNWVIVLVLGSDSKYSLHGPDLFKLISGVEAEKGAREGKLDELIIVAEDAFFGKKNLTDVIGAAQERQHGGVDAEGLAPYYSAHPYRNFALVVPKHVSVPPHRLMSPAEVEEFISNGLMARNDVSPILSTDPPIVWLGGRAGEFVEILRDSNTALNPPTWRRII